MLHIVRESSIGTDRRATWNEVRRAMLFLSEGECKIFGPCGGPDEMDLNFIDRIDTFSEDAIWWSIIRELPPSWLN